MINGYTDEEFWGLYNMASPKEKKIIEAAVLVEKARTSPGDYAHITSRGKWQWAPHLRFINNLLVSASEEQRFIIISVSVRTGKALGLDTPTPTPKGFVKHGDLKPGDEVYDLNRNRCKVLATSTVFTGETFKVKNSDGESFYAHANHIWPVLIDGTLSNETTKTLYQLYGSEFDICTPFGERLHFDKTDLVPTSCIQVDSEDGIYLIGETGTPTHNSELISRYFPSWFIGKYPDKKVLITSYNAEMANGLGRFARDLTIEHGERIFGVKVRSDSKAVNDWGVVGHNGRVFSAGVDGSLTGRGGNLCIIDDPSKSLVDIHSRAQQEKLREWYKSVFRTRLEPGGSIILVMSRWAKTDLAGWILENAPMWGDDWQEFRLPMIATEDNDLIGRKIGEPLWPERYSLKDCENLRNSVGSLSWSSLYQQDPISQSDTLFPLDRWKYVNQPPLDAQYVRSWDLSASRSGDYTAGVLMCRDSQNFVYIVDVQNIRRDASETERYVRMVAEMDSKYPNLSTIIEQAPGAGAAVADNYVRNVLAGFKVEAVPARGKKIDNAQPFAAQVQAGNVSLCRKMDVETGMFVAQEWWEPFITQLYEFPASNHDDMCDAASHAYQFLALRNFDVAGKKPIHVQFYNPNRGSRESGRSRNSYWTSRIGRS